MSIVENKAIVRRFVDDVYGRDDSVAFAQLVHPDIVVSYPLLPEPVHGREAFKAVLSQFRAALPDLEASLDELIAEDDKVAVRWSLAGTQLGAFGPIPGTGKRVRWTGISICRIADGKVIEDRGEEDVFGLMQQLGAIPAPEPAAA
jgi:steroid delta-isomerase-like uncharacterized protein